MFTEEKNIEGSLNVKAVGLKKHLVSIKYWGLREVIASGAWIANDFAFYGNKLQQGLFLNILFPTATPYIKQQWNILNSFISLLGYYLAAALCDKTWYGRRNCQWIGFFAMFVFYIAIWGEWDNMATNNASANGARALQALYYLSSFFNQFGPNATTWLVAGEIFPTDIRGAYHARLRCQHGQGGRHHRLPLDPVHHRQTGDLPHQRHLGYLRRLLHHPHAS